MKSTGGMALLLVIAVSIGAWAQCGCGAPEEPNCYLAFKTTETIEFSLVAPGDYFGVHQTSVSPSIFGWRVEAWDGTVVRTVIYPGEPRSRLTIMEWDLYDDNGYLVPSGYYRIVVMTTDSDVAYPVRIVETCRSFCGCYSGCYAPRACDVPCCTPYGELYLALNVGETRRCAGLTFSLTFTFECSDAAP
jgi:hypothetical protein